MELQITTIITAMLPHYQPPAVPDALQASPKKSMQNLDDFQSMLALCKVVNPAVADRIEQEMVIEIERIRSSTDQSSNESGKEALGVLEGSLRVEQASKGFEVARKLARGAKWEQWVGGLFICPYCS